MPTKKISELNPITPLGTDLVVLDRPTVGAGFPITGHASLADVQTLIVGGVAEYWDSEQNGIIHTTGSALVGGIVTASLGFTGSLTKLVDGTDYLRAGQGIDISTGSGGWVMIENTSVVAEYWDSTTADSIFTTGSALFRDGSGTEDSPLDYGTDNFFYVSGSIGSKDGSTPGVATFGGDVVISGTLHGGSPLDIGSDVTITGSLSQGRDVLAYGPDSHAQGINTVTTGSAAYSHAEGSLSLTGRKGWTIVNITQTQQQPNTAIFALDSSYDDFSFINSLLSGFGPLANFAFTNGDGTNPGEIYTYIVNSVTYNTNSQQNPFSTKITVSNLPDNSGGPFIGTVVCLGIDPENSGLIQSPPPPSPPSVSLPDQPIGGYASHSEGFATITLGLASHSEGSGSIALGNYSHAEGYQTNAAGFSSHAEGFQTFAQGSYSHAEGFATITLGLASHSEGSQTFAQGNYSHAEGESTNASGFASHAEGFQTTASNDYSHAEGHTTYAVGESSHAEGVDSVASGIYSHAEGDTTSAIGEASHAEGLGTIASGSYQHVQGKYNLRNNNFSLFVIGDGIGDADPQRGDIIRVNSGSVPGLGRVEITGSLAVSGSNSRVEVTGSLAATLGLSGSLTKLTDGSDYLRAGSGIDISTGSQGEVTIAMTSGGSGLSTGKQYVAPYSVTNSTNSQAIGQFSWVPTDFTSLTSILLRAVLATDGTTNLTGSLQVYNLTSGSFLDLFSAPINKHMSFTGSNPTLFSSDNLLAAGTNFDNFVTSVYEVRVSGSSADTLVVGGVELVFG